MKNNDTIDMGIIIMNIQEVENRLDNILGERYVQEIDKSKMLNEVGLCETEGAVDTYVAMSREYIMTKAVLDSELASLRAIKTMMTGG